MTKQQKTRIIGYILVFTMLLTFFQFPVTTSKAGEPETAEPVNLDLKQIPEVMEDDDELLKGPALRLDTEEDPLNVIRYLESWDSQKTIIFPTDVKYVDGNGTVKDKSNKLYPSEKQSVAWETRDNDILTAFSANSQSGIESTYLGYKISLHPDVEFNSEAEINEDGFVIYRNAFGEKIDFKGTPTFDGNKADIVLNEKPSSNRFRLEIEIAGGELISENGTVSAVVDGTVVCRFAEVYVKDASGNFTFGSLNVIDNDTLEIEVPEAFLEDDRTVFPVLVDPILYFVTNRAYNGDNINTAQLDSFGCMNGGYITKSSLMAFAQSGTSNLVHPIVRFPYLYAVIQNMNNVQNAEIILYRESKYNGTTNTTITAKPITSYWIETYYSASSYSSIYSATSSSYNATSNLNAGASASGHNTFTITNLVNQWRQGNWVNGNGVYGISFSIGTYAYPATFHGGLTATSGKMPRLAISHSYTATGQIQDGIYFISPAASFSGGGTNYCMTRTVAGNTVKTSTALMADCSTQNYPITNSGYISYMRDLNQLYKIEYTNVGYRIKCLKTGEYLAFLSGSNLCYVANDDTTNFTTRWSFVKVKGKYYIVSYFYHYLTVDSPLEACDVDVNLYTESDGVLWDLKLYMLDVKHIGQNDYTSCGPTCVKMIIDYYLPGNTVTKDDIVTYAHNAVGSGFGAEHVQFSLHYYLSSFNLYPTGSTYCYYTGNKDGFYNVTKENIEANVPVVYLLKIPTTVFPFQYTLSNGNVHFVIGIGAYTDSSGTKRIIVLDPYPRSDPSYPGASSDPTYAVMDVLLDSLHPIATSYSDTLIRHIY